MADDKAEPTKKITYTGWLQLGGFVTIAALMITYSVGMWIANGFSWPSANTSDWGTFGDFVGGVANPVIALLALLGLIRTIQQQQNEFTHLKTEMKNQVTALDEQQQEMERQRKIMSEQLLAVNLENISAHILNDIKNLLNEKVPLHIRSENITFQHAIRSNKDWLGQTRTQANLGHSDPIIRWGADLTSTLNRAFNAITKSLEDGNENSLEYTNLFIHYDMLLTDAGFPPSELTRESGDDLREAPTPGENA